jgi:hypothetical protein
MHRKVPSITPLPVTRIRPSFASVPDMKCFITSPQHSSCSNVTYGVVHPSYSPEFAHRNIGHFGPCGRLSKGKLLQRDDEMKIEVRRWMQTRSCNCLGVLCGEVEGLFCSYVGRDPNFKNKNPVQLMVPGGGGDKILGPLRNEVGTRWRGWLRYCATSRKVAGSIPDGGSWNFSSTSSFW